MLKQLDVLSKQGILVAVLTIVQCLLMLFSGIQMLGGKNRYDRMLQLDDFAEVEDSSGSEEDAKSSSPYGIKNVSRHYHTATVVASVLAILFSALMLFGILKRRKNFMAPWIILFVLSVIAFVAFFIFSCFTNKLYVDVPNAFDELSYACVVFYPVIMLYMQLRREECEKKKQSEVSHVISHPKFNPYFVEPVQKTDETVL